MAYILTETDLDALQQAGITGVPAGVEATPEEMRILGVLDPALTDSFAMGDTTGVDVTGMTPDPNYQNGATPTAPLPQQVNSQPAGGFGVLDFQTSPPVDDFSYLEDPYSNLSKTQRRMLAFSAIKDAGMALQGKEGNSYATMMADITARADMARKAKAAQAQAERDRLMQMQVMALLGGGSAAAGIGQTVLQTQGGDLKSQIDRLNSAIPQLISAGYEGQAQALLMQRDRLQAELDAQTAEAEEEEVTNLQRQKAMSQTQNIIDAIDEALRIQVGEDFEGKLDAIISGDETGWRWLASGRSSPDSRLKFETFVANVDRVKSIMTFDNMAAMKAAGVTFGSLSNSELAQVASTVGALDARENPRLAAKEIARIYKDLKEKMVDYELDALMGG